MTNGSAKPAHRLTIVDIAAIAHACNREYCAQLGDLSQPEWNDAPPNIQASAIDGVQHALANPEATPEQSHENWCRFKLADGWCWGEIKDSREKTHPCLVPYDQLPLEQQIKDHLFKGIVRTLAPFLIGAE